MFVSVALSIRNDRNIYVNSASANPFAIFGSTSPITPNWKITFITAVWNFTFAIQNPNEKFVMPFSRFDFNVSYGKDVLSSGSIEPFELKKKELNLVKKTINALPITLFEQTTKRMEDELQKSKAVNFHITLKGTMEGTVVLLTWRQIITQSIKQNNS
ncbi:hypothetical protein QYF36_014924 [Acer negundo]|nr:hypothetical protein QYF36_014924 [Acer negundo]